jgi:hypothetical protein
MSKTVIVDIDPMAEHISNDIKKIEKSSAIGRVERPLIPTHGLADAISSGSQEVVFNTLIKRMVDYALANLAKKMHMEVTSTAGLPAQEAKDIFRIAVESRSQQVLNLTKFVIQNFKSTLNGMPLAVLGPVLDQMIAHDPSKPNGLSDLANVTLELAKSALIEQMKVDMNAGNLDERRIAELMGEGPGAEIVAQLILLPILNQFSH